jgi:pyruvate/2-oxoglutarate dehydrogenase complex dihydrolipoamide dehydrogenase (E3) component
MKKFDVMIIGGGPAGLVASKILVAFGKKTAIVEKAKLGGDCTHSGCVPSKTLLKSAKAYHDTKNISKYGLSSNTINIDSSNVLNHVRSVVDEIYSHETPAIFEKAGVCIIEGFARFISKDEIVVKNQTYKAKKFILATGSSPMIPDIPGLENIKYLTNQNIFLEKSMPKSMTIIGTGVIGVEMATAFNRLGTQVTLISRSVGILKQNDEELSNTILNELKKEGVKFINNATYEKVEQTEHKTILHIKQNQKDITITSQKILIAVGRVANTDINLEKAEVKFDKNGVTVDEYLQTSNPNIYSIGDVSTKYKFTHIAEQEAIVAASNIGLPIRKKINYNHIGSCIYSDPELAQIGYTQKEANKLFVNKVQTYKFEYKNSDRGYTDVDKIGMIKVSVLNSGKIVGASVLGSRAGELVHILQLAKTFDISFEKLSKIVYLYPTYADVVKQPAKQFYINKLLNNKLLKLLKYLKSILTKAQQS